MVCRAEKVTTVCDVMRGTGYDGPVIPREIGTVQPCRRVRSASQSTPPQLFPRRSLACVHSLFYNGLSHILIVLDL